MRHCGRDWALRPEKKLPCAFPISEWCSERSKCTVMFAGGNRHRTQTAGVYFRKFKGCARQRSQGFQKSSEVGMRSILLCFLAVTMLGPNCHAQAANAKHKPGDLSLTAVGGQHHPLPTTNGCAEENF